LNRTALVFFDIAAVNDPFASQLRDAFAHIRPHGWIAIGTSGVIDAHGRILFQLVLEVAGWVLVDFAKRNAHTGLLAVDVDAA
jgi:hypothetical protein